MGKSPLDNKNQKSKKTINAYAITTEKSGVTQIQSPLQYFADSIGKPPYINHTREYDHAFIKAKLFGTEIDESLIKQEKKKIEEINKRIKITQGKQIAYVLTEIGKRLNKSETEINDILEQNSGEYKDGKYTDGWTTEKFLEKLNYVKRTTYSNGTDIPVMGKKIDEKGNEIAIILATKTTPLSEKEINQIFFDSALVENIGSSENEYVDPLKEDEEKSAEYESTVIYNHSNQRGAETEKYEEYVQKIVLKETGYDAGFLTSKFEDCFDEEIEEISDSKLDSYLKYPSSLLDNSEINKKIGENTSIVGKCDYKMLNEIRQSIITEKMNALPEEQRTEKAFVEECEKLDVAINAYVFPKFDCTPGEEFFNTQKDGYYQFALSNISPTAAAKNTETQFNDYLEMGYNQEITNKDGLDHAAVYIKHLEDMHKKRPFMTRFFDYFKRDGEDSTIKRMKNALIQKGYTKQEIKEAVETTPHKLYGTNIDKRYENLSNNKLSLPKNVAGAVNEFDKKYDEAIKKANQKIKETTETTKETVKETEKEKTDENLRTMTITIVKTTETTVEENTNAISEEKKAEANQQMKEDIVKSLNDRKPKEEVITEKVTETKVVSLEKETDTLSHDK